LADSDPVALMVAQPSLIKRPVIAYPGGLLVGFDAAEWEKALA
jgi:arsenate reductase-like glutaredoxin family protein